MKIWEGTYINKPEIKDDYFSTSIWRKKTEKKIKILFNSKKSLAINHNILEDFINFKFVKKVNILDYGGGYGNIYFLLNHLKKEIKIFVFDNQKKIIEKSKKLFKNKKKKILFFNKLKKVPRVKIDILYFGSVMQYIFDLKKLSNEILEINPQFIVIYDLMSDKNPNFFSYQNFYGKKMLVKFHNFNSLVKMFKSINYEVIHKRNMNTFLLNKYQPLPMKNFPKKFRILYSKQIILKKILNK